MYIYMYNYTSVDPKKYVRVLQWIQYGIQCGLHMDPIRIQYQSHCPGHGQAAKCFRMQGNSLRDPRSLPSALAGN